MHGYKEIYAVACGLGGVQVYLQQHIAFRRALSRFFVHGVLLRPVNSSVLSGPATVSLVPAQEIKHNLTLPSYLLTPLHVTTTRTALVNKNLLEFTYVYVARILHDW